MLRGASATSQVLFATCKLLSPTERLVGVYLYSCPPSWLYCSWGAERIAAAVGCSIAAVRSAIRKLCLLGYLEYVKDAALRTGRRLLLVLRRKPLSPPTEEKRDVPASPGRFEPPTPKAVSRTVRTAAPSGPPAPPPEEERPEREGAREQATRKATREEVARVVKLAQTSIKHPPTRKTVLETAKRYRLSWVERAIQSVKGKAKYWGLVVNECELYEELGGPPKTEEEREIEHWAEIRRQIHALWGPPGEVEGVPEGRTGHQHAR